MPTITLIYLTALCAGSFVGLVRWKHLTSPFKLLWALVCFTFVEEFLLHAFNLSPDQSLMVYRIYTVVAFTLYYSIYFKLFKKSFSRTFSLLSILSAFLVSCVAPISFEENSVFPSLPIFVCVSLLILNALISFYEMLLFPSRTKLVVSSNFWLNTLNLFYWSSTIVFFGSYNLAIKAEFNIAPYINVHNVLGILYYLGLAYTLYLDRHHTSPSNPARL